MARWARSPARADLLAFVRSLAAAVRGVSLRAPVAESAGVVAVCSLLAKLEARPPPRVARSLTCSRAGVGGRHPARAAGHALRQHRVSHLARSLPAVFPPPSHLAPGTRG